MKLKWYTSFVYTIALLFLMLPILFFLSDDRLTDLSQINMIEIIQALKVSFFSSFVSMIIVFMIGIPAGYFIARTKIKYKAVLDLMLHLPMVLPPAVIGLLVLLTYGPSGPIGYLLNRIGIKTSFSVNAVIIVFIFTALPLFIKGCAQAFYEVDTELEQTAKLLGDSDGQVFKRITYPLAKEGIKISLLMSWCRGLSEFGATIMFAGNLKGVTQTLPLAIYTAMESNFNNAMVLSLIMLVIAVIVLSSVHILSRKQVKL